MQLFVGKEREEEVSASPADQERRKEEIRKEEPKENPSPTKSHLGQTSKRTSTVRTEIIQEKENMKRRQKM